MRCGKILVLFFSATFRVNRGRYRDQLCLQPFMLLAPTSGLPSKSPFVEIPRGQPKSSRHSGIFSGPPSWRAYVGRKKKAFLLSFQPSTTCYHHRSAHPDWPINRRKQRIAFSPDRNAKVYRATVFDKTGNANGLRGERDCAAHPRVNHIRSPVRISDIRYRMWEELSPRPRLLLYVFLLFSAGNKTFLGGRGI